MKTVFTSLLLSLMLLSCQSNASAVFDSNQEPKIAMSIEEDSMLNDTEPSPPDSLALALQHAQMLSRYDSLLTDLKKRKQVLSAKFKASGNDSIRKSILNQAKNLLHKRFTQELFPCWYGTAWDFNGISNRPGQGEIACGYFVSTSLKHAGFRLNRYKVAQQGASEIVRLTCSDKKTFHDFEKMMTYLQSRPNSLFVVGLDNHVGFIETHNADIFFTHASYVGPVAVLKESARGSDVLPHSWIYVLGEISSPKITERWLLDL